MGSVSVVKAGEANGSNNSALFSVQRNPLLIDTVLQSLFKFVDYDTLKVCRLVTTKWKSLSDSLFLKRSTFVVDRNTVAKIADREQFLESPPDIPSLFRSISQQGKEIIFSSLKLSLHLFSTSVRKVYLEPNKLTMKHLKIGTNWSSDSGPSLTIAPGHNADDLIGPNLTKLKLNSRGYSNLVVSLEKLLSLRQIDLRNWELLVHPDLSGGEKMAPEELKLVCLKIQPRSVQLREIVNFQYLQKLHIDVIRSSERDGVESEQTLSLSDLRNVKYLTIMFMKINLNGKISPKELEFRCNTYELNGAEVEVVSLNSYVNSGNIKIKKMVLGDEELLLDFTNSTIIDELNVENLRSIGNRPMEAQVKKLKLINSRVDPNFSMIDLALLPLSLEYLELGTCRMYSVTSSNPTVFPNLKQLILVEHEQSLAYFKNCPLLTRVIVDRLPTNKVFFSELFDVNDLPMSIKWLSINYCINLQPVGSQLPKMLELEVLELFSRRGECSFRQVIPSLQVLSNFTRADLVIVHGAISNPGAAEFSQEDISQIKTLKQSMGIQNIVYGPALWVREKYLDNLGNLKDRKLMPKRDYFLVGDDNNTGKGMSRSDLIKMIPRKYIV